MSRSEESNPTARGLSRAFFILGAEKSATTSLYHSMKQHPELFMAPQSTIFELEECLAQGLPAYRKTHLQGWDGRRVVGNEVAGALFYSHIAESIRTAFPEARLIVSLRNPIDRAYSHWWMRYEEGSESLPFRDAIQQNLDRLRNEGELDLKRKGRSANLERTYLEQGHYAQQIRHYLRFFPRSQLRILLFEDFIHAPMDSLNGIFAFLGVDSPITIQQEPPHMVAMGYFGRKLHRAARKTGLIGWIPPALRAPIRRMIASVDQKRPPIDPEIREQLVEYFKPHNRALVPLLERDLSHWDA